MNEIDAEWFDICYAIDPGPATWQDWIDMGRAEPGGHNHMT